MTTTWPDLLAYNEAVQNPKRCFADPDLAGGQVATNALGWPLPFTGNFASVYRVSTPGPVPHWAVKCFTREVPDLQQRYQAVSDHLQARQGGPPFMVPFVYLPRGILVQGTWWPVLKMHWVEGFALNEFVRTHADKPQVLTNLAALWLKLAEELRGAGMAHGDLQHGNVILVKSERGVRLKLVDYDGLFVPALAATPPEEAGHPNYQHPGRRQAPYDFEIDRFSHLVIYTALRCLACEGGESLWRQYDNGDNLLFRQEDFAAPGQSVLFRQLWSRRDFAERSLVGHLMLAALARADEVPWLADLVTNGLTRPLTAAQEQTLNGLFRGRQGSSRPAPPGAQPPQSRATPPPDWLEQRPTVRSLPPPAPVIQPPVPPSRPARKRGAQKLKGIVVAATVVGLAAALVGTWLHYGSHEEPPAQPDQARPENLTPLAATAREAMPAPAPSPPPAAPLPRWARRVLRGHTEGVASIAFSRDGQRLASGSYDRTVKVWDAGTGKELLTLTGHTEGVTGVAFRPDGKRLASGSYDGMVKVWDADAGKELHTLREHKNSVTSVAYSPDGKHLASGSRDKSLKVWDVDTDKAVLGFTGHLRLSESTSPIAIISVAFSSDGRRVLSGSNNWSVKTWDVGTGTPLGTLTLWGPNTGFTSVAFSPDGRRIVSSSRDKTATVWDVGLREEVVILKGHTEEINGVAFSPDSRYVASGSDDHTVKVWDATSGQELLDLQGHTGGVNSVSFSPDGAYLLSGSRDSTLILWDLIRALEAIPPNRRPAPSEPVAVKTPQPPKLALAFQGHSGSITSIAFSPDGQRLATSSHDGTVKVWDTVMGLELLTFTMHMSKVSCVAFSPDGQHIVSSTGGDINRGEVRVWEASTGKEVLAPTSDIVGIACVAFSPDGRHIATAGGDWTVKIRDVGRTKEVFNLKGHTGGVTAVAFSPDSRHVASGSIDKTVKVWDVGKTKEILTLKSHAEGVTGVAFSPDGRHIASASQDRTVKIWLVRTGEEVLTFKKHIGSVWSVAFSPDGRHIASGDNEAIKIWEKATGKEVFTIMGHTGWVKSVVFSPDGKRLASGSGRTVRVWDVPPDPGGDLSAAPAITP